MCPLNRLGNCILGTALCLSVCTHGGVHNPDMSVTNKTNSTNHKAAQLVHSEV